MKRILVLLAAALVVAGALGAQAKAPAALPKQSIELAFDSLGKGIPAVLADKSTTIFYEGDSIPAGATLSTPANGTAELKLVPNGTIIKLAKATSFTVKNFATTSAESNAVALVAGKVRAVAAKGSNLTVSTPSAVCGIRGTDFALSLEGGKELLMVKKGLVAFAKGAGAELAVGAGMAADALAAAFETAAFSAEQYGQEFADMVFDRLDELAVPQDEVAALAEAAAASPDGTASQESTATEAAATVAEGLGKMSKDEVESGLVKWIREVLGMELGSVMINGTTYSKAIIAPNFNLGKLKLGLYLPIIYSSNLFDPADWYRPAGNDEWSFGTQRDAGGLTLWETDPLAAGIDAAKDLALKIKYIEIGRQLEDPFFLKVGNLNSLTVGHGLLMRNYANDTEFPAIRRVGFNLGIDGGKAGFEAMVNDLAVPEIFGGRLYFRPVPNSKIALGVSGVADLSPASDLSSAEAAAVGNPIFIGAGLDLDIPIVSGDFLSIRAFADGAAMLPYTRTAIGSVQPGLQYGLLWTGDTVKNWGSAAGLMGRVLFLDWRLEYRYYTGIFKPAFFDTAYDKNRSSYAAEYADYIDGSKVYADTPTVMGIYGEGGFKFLKDKLSFTLAYAWPWDPSAASVQENLVLSSDEFHAKLVVLKGLIPIIDVSGAISYDRRGLAQAISAGNVQLIDRNTTFGGELVVPVPKTPNLDVAVVFATVPERSASGALILDGNGFVEQRPSISFETRFHF